MRNKQYRYLKYSDFLYSKILIIERDIWTDRAKCEEALKEKFGNIEINGVIIIDHQRFCKGAWNNVFDYECFRPSYPTLDIT